MLTLLVSLALFVPAGFAKSDHLGGTDTENSEGDMLKLVVIDADEAVAVTRLQFSVSAQRGTGDVTLVVYHEVGADYELLDSVVGTGLPNDGDGAADSGAVTWLLEAGESYAVGAYLEGGWGYFYSEGASDDPWFGATVGSLRYEDGSPPSSFQADLEEYYYDMDLDSEPADADADGAVAKVYGGEDCDDADPAVGPGGVEVAYDGIDQDCVGGDLADVDGDGVDSDAVGGRDCDDNDAAVGPEIAEICGDDLDQDCSGADKLCGGDGGDGVDASASGCGCDSGGGAGLLGVVIGAAVLRRRRGVRA